MRYFPDALKPGWIDEARLLVQEPAFRAVLGADSPLRGRCLNAGCGEGLYVQFLESFPSVTEIVHMDVSHPAFVDRLLNPRHKAVQGSLTELPFENASFDSALCSEVLEHIADDAKAVRELARVIKPGGRLLVSVPFPPAPPDPAHVREGYRLPELTALLESNGFSVRRHGYTLHAFMRLNYRLWAWQIRVLGKGRKSFLPRGWLRLLARADAHWNIGKPWDLVVFSERRS